MRNRLTRIIKSSFTSSFKLKSLDRARALHIRATPSGTNPESEIPFTEITDIGATHQPSTPDVRFEVLGPLSSLLSINLSASQNLYTRRGTLVGISGNPENAISTLTPLAPIVRAPLGIPWLFQRIASTTPLGLLVATKSAHTSFAILNLDGRIDWMVAQRNGLVAWSGHNLTIKPKIDTRFSLAHWGKTYLTGRGLVALTGSGNIYEVKLKADDQYIARPSNVLAYSLNTKPPQPYRFKTSSIPLSIPNIGQVLPTTAYFRNIRESRAFKLLAQALFTIRTWSRRFIWGDRLFMRFEGPGTLLLQSRGSYVRDVLTDRDVNEIADNPAGAIQEAVTLKLRQDDQVAESSSTSSQGPAATLGYASVDSSGKVIFSKDESPKAG